ncbi:MAG TPA: saccharopine dehydrogenase NADP-binding domain-containing protein [Candidatus Nanopelagicales bacterium]|nr:saccharopine dehydrogenase NADP-binding domain-containing protein [Candidatus Nanopelagicales bacterium]
MSDREYDVIVFGATGFTGRLVAEHLARRAASPGFRWAIAGRSADKLAHVKSELEAPGEVGIIEADAGDPASLARMAQRTRVVLSTVGPYARHGEPVVAACVQEGADYVDITGEPDFVDLCLARYHGPARDKGLRLVNCCGFDSVPHDLGALFTVERLPSGEPIVLEAFVRAHGTFSGGTWQSAINAFSEARHRGALFPEPPPAGGDRRVRLQKPRIRYDRALRAWVCSLPTIDPQIVLRSAAALDVYGPDFSYGHYAQVRSGARLAGGIAGIGAIAALAQLGPTRDLLRRVRPAGEGPSPEERARHWFQVTFRGQASSRQVVTRVSGGDPGYSETSKMVAESALCLALDRERLPDRTGVLTPAVAMGDLLINRLQQVGIRFELLEG